MNAQIFLYPNEGETPKFLQMYIYDPLYQHHLRKNLLKKKQQEDKILLDIINNLSTEISQCNIFINKYKNLYDTYKLNGLENYGLSFDSDYLPSNNVTDADFSLPTTSQIAMISCLDEDNIKCDPYCSFLNIY